MNTIIDLEVDACCMGIYPIKLLTPSNVTGSQYQCTNHLVGVAELIN